MKLKSTWLFTRW